MNRVMQILCAVAVASFLSVNADAADPFRTTSNDSVSSASLSAMGLGGMKQVTNDEASQVRGRAAFAFGVSSANFNLGPFSSSDLRVQAATGNFVAGTGSISAAGLVGGPVVFAAGAGIAGGF